MTNWISVQDELPPHEEMVLIADEVSGFVTFGIYDQDTDLIHAMYFQGLDLDMIPTHWADKPKFYSDSNDSTY